ncbi:MAG: exonuclease SbcCD subunit D [Lachnospiraceae bacterium]|nr:exonuclease SbcCD subunit D [Lachnospiraceae bacterium]
MKFIHLSDLHLGKKLHQLSLLGDQEYILEEILNIVKEEKPDALLLAGDIYDKIYPPAEAVALFDSFLVRLAEEKCRVFVISGNHDSPERIAFLGRLTKLAGVYLSPVYQGEAEGITLEDEFGEVTVWLLPFIKPLHVRHFYPKEEITDYTQAMEVAIRQMSIDSTKRNVLVAHQFVLGASRSDSEEVSVGGLDHVAAEVFADFDYVALGHLHRPQWVGRKEVRYSGTPLKYSFSESEDKKSVTVIELGEKGQVKIREYPLTPRREVLRLKGEFLNLMEKEDISDRVREAYVQITLLDEEDVPDAFNRLSLVYSGLLHLEYDNTRTRTNREIRVRKEHAILSPEQLFAGFYEEMNNQPLNEKQLAYLQEKMETIWKGESL